MKPVIELLSSIVKLGLLAAIPAYLLIDHFFVLRTEGQQAERREERDLLCRERLDAEAEKLRLDALPVSALGKMHHFVLCAEMTKVRALGFEAEVRPQERLERAQEESLEKQELLALVNSVEQMLIYLAPDELDILEIAEVQGNLTNIRGRLTGEITAQERVIARVETQALAKETIAGDWILVAAAYSQRQGAEAATSELAMAWEEGTFQGVSDIAIMDKNGYYNPVLIFPDRSQARAVMETLPAPLQPGVFVRAWEAFCPEISGQESVATDFQLIRCEGKTPG